MKSFVMFTFLAFTSASFASAEWKVVAETENCAEKAQVLAKEGEKFVKVTMGGTTQKLFSDDGSAFSSESKKTTQFSTKTSEKRALGEPTFKFTQPSMVEANPAKLDVFQGGKMSHCRMASK